MVSRPIAARVPVVIPAIRPHSLLRKVLSGGPRQVIELEAWEQLELAEQGLRVFFVREESPINHDSAMVVLAAGTVLNMNDARLSPGQLRRICSIATQVDVFALRAAGASWYLDLL